MVEDEIRKVKIGQDEFGGLIGGIAGNFLQQKIGGGAGDIIGGLLRGGGQGVDRGGFDVGNLIGQIVGGGGGSGGGGGNGYYDGDGNGRGGGRSRRDFAGGNVIGDILGGLISGGRGPSAGYRSGGGGENIPTNFLQGGVIEILSELIGKAAHKFLGIDPQTGRIIGAVAGNVIFSLGGKDNKLSDIGKIILDNIISGNFKRKVQPFVPHDPEPVPRPTPHPRPSDAALDFYDERDRCLKSNTLFEDPEFPANDSSLFYSRRIDRYIEWKRPGELVRDPQLITEGQSRFDVIQGELGDCWLMAGAASITLRDELFYRVVPPDQSFTDNYAGIFHFQFWHYGEWVDVVIDDRLPTSDGKLLYMHSRELNEFWSPLLEKAYAKLHGNYEALKGGTTSEALEDMTGGLTEFVDLKQPPKNLLQMMFRGFEMSSLFGCSIEASPLEFEARTREGLVKGHAYSITGMRMVETQQGTIPLLRIRNPWGNAQEWNGDWSDNSALWDYVSSEQKRDMNLVLAHDGEFWMSFQDFMKHFDKMEICNLGPDVMDEVTEMTGVSMSQAGYKTWNARTHLGVWSGQSAGGCRNYLNSFAYNPQYCMTLSSADPNDADGLCTVIIAVLQKYRRELKPKGIENLAIGFAVYEVDDYRGRLGRSYFATNKSIARSAAFINLREVTGRFRLPPGIYVIVPSTFEPGEEGEFMLRIFSNVVVDSEELG